jgi:hypothetical protein
VNGFLDGIEDGEIFGWAMDRSSPDASVLLNVAVLGRPLMTIGTFEYRPEVAAAFGNQGMNGFRFQLPAHVLNETVVDVSVVSEAGDHLSGSPMRSASDVLQSGSERVHRRDEPCVLFIHIPRTSGTAFREAIEPNYPGSQRLYYYPTPPGIWHERFETLPARQRRSFKFVAGHFVFGLHEKIDAPCEYITMVRDPVERVISNYCLAVRNKPETITSSSGEILTLEEVLEQQLLAELDNLTVRCFGGYGGMTCPAGRLGREAYDVAVENTKHFRFIGHQDRSEEAWSHLRQMFGWQRGALRRVNAGQPLHHEFSRRTRIAIEHYCRYDIEFYKKILTA